jgi:hypothetical protein
MKTTHTPKVTVKPEGFETWNVTVDGTLTMVVTVSRKHDGFECHKSFDVRRVGTTEVVYASPWLADVRKAVKVLAVR